MANIGAIWVRKDKNGQTFYSIKFGEKFYKIFRNIKKNDKQPDFTIMDGDQQSQQARPNEPEQFTF